MGVALGERDGDLCGLASAQAVRTVALYLRGAGHPFPLLYTVLVHPSDSH